MRSTRTALSVVSLLVGACTTKPSPADRLPTHEPRVVVATRYPLTGRIVAIDAPRHVVVIAHDAIPGYMAPMTMPYPVGESIDFSSLIPGDRVSADVVVSPDSVWLEHVVIQHRERPAP